MARAQESSSQVKKKAPRLRAENPDFARWAKGYGVIRHSDVTQARVADMQSRLEEQGDRGDAVPFYELLYALDRVASAGMWLVVHETYARNVYLDGRALSAEDFKPRPEGHTGGALNTVPAYAGYLAVNAFRSGATSMLTRLAAWRRGAISGSPSCNMFTCRFRERGSWLSCRMELSKSSAAATGRRAGGAPRTRGWLRQL